MRIKLFFGPNQAEIKEMLNDKPVKVLNICLGDNNRWHDGKSPYSISQLQGGVKGDNKFIQYPNGAWMVVSSTNGDFLKDFFNGLFENANTLKIDSMNFIGYYTYDIKVGDRFDNIRVDKLRLKVNDKEITYKDENFIELLKEQCVRKLKAIGFNDDDLKTFNIEPFHSEKWKYVCHKTKLYLENPVITPCTSLMLTLKGKRDVREKLIHLGIGNSTGAGFGFAKLTGENENNKNLIIKL